jgi:DNA (cytosine-5)-methyltransferase 1
VLDRTVNSFFAGIGGFDLGFGGAGFRTLAQSEVDPGCLGVLRRHWPLAAQAGDVAAVDPASLPEAGVWCAGFPCQGASLARAGPRGGLRDARTGLFFAFAGLVGTHGPPAVVLENVPGLLSSNGGADFRTVLDVLSGHGYSVAWRTLNSRWFGVPQSRPRVFLVARPDPADAARALFEPVPPAAIPERDGALREPDSAVGVTAPRVSFCLAATSGRHTGTDWSRTYVIDGGRARRMTPEECEAIQGFPGGWTASGAGPAEDAARYRMCGNAVSVPVARWIASMLLGSGQPDLGAHGFGDAIPQPAASFAKWPRAGLWSGGLCRTAPACSVAPSAPAPSRLIDLVRGGADERFFISANAAAGILRRAGSMGRSLFRPLREALARLSLG